MSKGDDLYSKEATLVNNAKRELSDGKEKDPITKLRLMCFSRGATGLVGLAKTFRKMNEDENPNVDCSDFIKGVRENGLDCQETEIKEMFNSIDTEKNGVVTMSNILGKLRPEMSSQRVSILEKAFCKLDRKQQGAITPEDIRATYSVREHPKYRSGQMTADEIHQQFLNNFDAGRGDAKITKEEFVNYYATISASIDNDAYFDLLLRQSYKL